MIKSGQCPYVGSVVQCSENIWMGQACNLLGPNQLSQHCDSSTVLTTKVEFPGGTQFLATVGFSSILVILRAVGLGLKRLELETYRRCSHITPTFPIRLARCLVQRDNRREVCSAFFYVTFLFTAWPPRQREGPPLRVTLVKTVLCSIGFHKDTGQKIWLRA